jgi:eukaryotic-like serine/threonine-protein kinase
VGTIQYVSPEQIEGKEADARSDIFAFGAVLYEMAAGKRPFQGKSQISLASAILESDPEPLSTLKPETSRAFEHVVTTCLQKNPDDRYQTAQDIKLQLQWVISEKLASEKIASEKAAVTDGPLLSPSPAPPKHRALAWPSVAIVGLVLAAVAGFLLHRPAPVPSIRAVINPPDRTHINLTGDDAGPPVLSPDVLTIAFAVSGTDGKSSTITFTDGRPTVVVDFVAVNAGDEIDTVVVSAGGN